MSYTKSQLQHQKELEVARERIRNRKKRTRRLIQFGAIVDIVGYAILFFTSDGTIATAALGLIGLGFGFRSSMFFSMMPDIFDYTEW